MAAMTDEEADALDELLTRTTPKIRVGEGGFFTRQRNLLNSLDTVAANYIRSQSEIKKAGPGATPQTPQSSLKNINMN